MFSVFRNLFRRVASYFRADAGGTSIISSKVEPMPPLRPIEIGGTFLPFLKPRVVVDIGSGVRFEAIAKPTDAVPPPEPARESRHERRRADAMRRKYERARLKHDEWVKPGGPEPVKHERGPIEREPKPPAPLADEFVDPYQKIIVDEWNEGDGGEEVLFEESEFYGTFNFRDTILRQLDRYWVYIERMKRHDPDAYGFYKQLGASIRPYLATWSNFKIHIKKYRDDELEKYKAEIVLSPWFKRHYPSFGCVCVGTNPLDEERERTDLKGNLWTPKFMYFTRILSDPWPWYVQPVHGGRLYLLTVWWDRPDHPKTRHKWGVPNEFPIWISDDGNTIRALKTRETDRGSIRSEYDWRIPYAYTAWAKQYGLTAQLHLTHMFAVVARDVEQSYYATCRVEVSKGELTAVFGIEPTRIPYFFRDRDVTLTKNGRRERIFHVVRPHVRGDGTAVPMKFRGLREFEWAGYHVSITVPGRDHFLLQEFDVPAVVLKRKSARGKTESEVAAWLKEKIKSGFGAYRGG
jgi:hypothetical protein